MSATPKYPPSKYKRVLVKVSGEALMGDGQFGIDIDTVDRIARDVAEAAATGIELLFLGGMQVSVDDSPVNVADRLAYKGMMLEGVPNMAMAVGYTNASWTLKCDLTCDYVCRLLNRMREKDMTRAVPVNRDPSVTREPLLGLTSGYVMRSADRFPKQGSRHPWQVHQSYLKDYRILKRSDVVDDALELSRPAAEPLVAAAS